MTNFMTKTNPPGLPKETTEILIMQEIVSGKGKWVTVHCADDPVDACDSFRNFQAVFPEKNFVLVLKTSRMEIMS